MLEIRIERVPPSLNKLLRMHWGSRKRLFEEWRELIRLQLLTQGKGQDYLVQGPEEREVEIEIHTRKPRDIDNLYGGAVKIIADALKFKVAKTGDVIANLIYDDSDKFTKFSVKQKKSNNEMTIIRIFKKKRDYNKKKDGQRTEI